MGHPCTVSECGYVGQTGAALAGHIRSKHPEELRPIPPAPTGGRAPDLSNRRCAIYLRVSTIDQNPESQLPACRTFAAMRGWAVAQRPDGRAAIYEDRKSGKNVDREELQALIRDVSDDPTRYGAVIFRRMSRLGRSLRHNIDLFDLFQSLGVALISVEENVDTTTPTGRFIRNVMASVAEYQRENIVEQTMEGLALARAKGKRLGRHPAGCGIPVELGGLGPCPEGVQHKGFNGKVGRKEAARERDRIRKRRQRERAGQQVNAHFIVGYSPAISTAIATVSLATGARDKYPSGDGGVHDGDNAPRAGV